MMKVLQISKGWLYCFLCMLSLDAYAGNLADISTFNVSISGARQFGLAKTDYHVWLRLADDEWAKKTVSRYTGNSRPNAWRLLLQPNVLGTVIEGRIKQIGQRISSDEWPLASALPSVRGGRSGASSGRMWRRHRSIRNNSASEPFIQFLCIFIVLFMSIQVLRESIGRMLGSGVIGIVALGLGIYAHWSLWRLILLSSSLAVLAWALSFLDYPWLMDFFFSRQNDSDDDKRNHSSGR
ncbi:hypothetical protein PT286_07645 [Neisseriaceae bacterium ESL0693]|nr:hypothetical protein [Neisseriaceae bacterium ESL0693]